MACQNRKYRHVYWLFSKFLLHGNAYSQHTLILQSVTVLVKTNYFNLVQPDCYCICGRMLCRVKNGHLKFG